MIFDIFVGSYPLEADLVQQKLYVMRGSAGNSTAVLRSNNANSSLTIWL